MKNAAHGVTQDRQPLRALARVAIAVQHDSAAELTRDERELREHRFVLVVGALARMDHL